MPLSIKLLLSNLSFTWSTPCSRDFIVVHDDAPMRERKFKARQLGPYQLVSQDQDGAVMVKSLVDGKTLQRHHNRLRIFEGNLRVATILARLDNNENLSGH